MAKPSVFNVSDLFKEERQGAAELKISSLVPFKNHPFKLYEGDRLNDMVESIKEHGVITPLIVTETNLIQRSFSELSHSEKARILTERHNAIKQQGRRTDLIREVEMLSNTNELQENLDSRTLCENLRSDEKIGDVYNLSPRNVSYYLRIDTLINELKDRIDKNEIPFRAGVDLSFLKEEEQEIVEAILDDYGFKVDLKKSDILKTLSKGRNFNYNKAHEVLSGKYFDKPKASKKPKFSSNLPKI